MIWGYALPWFQQFLDPDEEPVMAPLKFLVQHRLRATHVALRELAGMSNDQRERLGSFLAEQDLHLVPTVWFDYLEPNKDAVKRNAEAAVSAITEYAPLIRAPIVTTGVGRYHRFMREPSLEEQMDRLPGALAPLAEACRELGCPLGIENHGDYYCEDLVELCRRTPHLFIFLDTGNTYLIGEQSLPAIRAAAPLTIGTHFKDHHVRPEKETYPLRFEIAGAVLGEGDVGLAEAHRILLDNAPDPANCVMLMEMIPPRPMDPAECLEKSLAFVRSLPEA